MLQADRRNFPGMRPEEAAVLRDWLRAHEADYDGFDYDVTVGNGRDPGADYPQAMRDMAIQNSQLRLDALLRKGGEYTIVEVKDRARPGVIGQLVTYRALWKQEHPDLPAPKALLVCRSALEGVETGCRDAGIEVEFVAVSDAEKPSILAGNIAGYLPR